MRYLAALAWFLLATSTAYAAEKAPSQCVTTAVAGGTGDAITIPLLPCQATTTLLILTFKAQNTTTTPTISENGRTPHPIVNFDGTALGIGDLAANQHRQLTFNGSKWILLNQNASGVGINQLTKDVLAGPGSGSQPATVVGIEGRPVDPTAPTVGQSYTWDGSKWFPTNPPTSGINQLLGPVTAGPGTGAQTTTITPTGVVAGSYTVADGNGNQFCWAVEASGQITGITAGACGGCTTSTMLIDTGSRLLIDTGSALLINSCAPVVSAMLIDIGNKLLIDTGSVLLIQ